MTTTEQRVIRHRFAPRGAARDLFLDKSPEILLSGPAGTGKSIACLEKLNFCALKYPGMRGLIVRKTRESIREAAQATFENKVIHQILANGTVQWKASTGTWHYSNGSRIMKAGMDHPTRIYSTEWDMVFVQEAVELRLGEWESLLRSLRNGRMGYHQLMADTNPDRDDHWLNQRALAGGTTMLESRHEDNPLLFDDDGNLTDEGAAYIGILDRMTGVRRERLRFGRWVSAEGIVYEEFDRQVNVVDRFDIPDQWPRYWAVDFGYRHPFVLQCWAEDPDGRLYLYREIFRTGRIVEDHARHILRLVVNRKGEWREPRPRAVICDHDAEDRATLERHLGMSTIPARKDVSPGIQAVQQRLRRAGDGKPGLMLFPDALVERDAALKESGQPWSTIGEFGAYVWNETKDQPVKEHDDGMDCLRYMVAHRDLQGVPRVRFM